MRSMRLNISTLLLFGLAFLAAASSNHAQIVGGETSPSSAHTDTARPQAIAWVVLSPRMPYALAEWPRMRRLAENAGFAMRPFRDPRVTDEEWARAIHAVGLTELSDADAMPADYSSKYGLLNHAPATLVWRCGQAHPWPILGVMPDTPWIEVLRARASWLKEQAC